MFREARGGCAALLCRPSVSSDGQGEAYRPFFTVASSTSVIHSAGPAMHADPVACYHFHFPCFYSTFTFPVLFHFHFTCLFSTFTCYFSSFHINLICFAYRPSVIQSAGPVMHADPLSFSLSLFLFHFRFSCLTI